VGASVEGDETIAAAFFDLDKTIISRSSTLAFGPCFYHHGLITRGEALRTAYAQLMFRLGGASHERMERIRLAVGELCRGWPADRVSEIVSRNLHETILPLVYADARRLIAAHGRAGQDVIIVSTSGQEMVGPIGDLLGASEVIATRMAVADGRYTGEMDFWAYGEAKADRVRQIAAARGYRLPDCYAYSDSVTDLPMLEAVGHPRAVNPDRALRKIARERRWPVLAFGARSAAGRAGIGQHSVAAASLLADASPAGSRPVPPARACEHVNQSRSRIGYAQGFTRPRIRRTKG
jgi:HAD superfamily hydrolase (TIGR01490 family)